MSSIFYTFLLVLMETQLSTHMEHDTENLHNNNKYGHSTSA